MLNLSLESWRASLTCYPLFELNFVPTVLISGEQSKREQIGSMTPAPDLSQPKEESEIGEVKTPQRSATSEGKLGAIFRSFS